MSFEDKAAQEKEQKRQKELDLVMNVFRRGQWGHYVSLPLEKGIYLLRWVGDGHSFKDVGLYIDVIVDPDVLQNRDVFYYETVANP